MKKSIILFLAALLVCMGSYYLYLTITPSLVGPKAAVSEACNAITEGMTPSELVEISDQYEGLNISTDSLNENLLEMSKVTGGWICICRANLQTENSEPLVRTVASVDRVFCRR